jgi:hypothetical protein
LCLSAIVRKKFNIHTVQKKLITRDGEANATQHAKKIKTYTN